MASIAGKCQSAPGLTPEKTPLPSLTSEKKLMPSHLSKSHEQVKEKLVSEKSLRSGDAKNESIDLENSVKDMMEEYDSVFNMDYEL